MVVLDVVHQIQATQAPDLACRWNCKAGKCGSCSAEVNGKPRLMCMTRMDTLPTRSSNYRTHAGFPDHQRPGYRCFLDYRINKMIPPFRPRPPTFPMAPGAWLRKKWTACRSFASASSVSCARTFATSLRDHQMKEPPEIFGGPRFMIRVASLEMHPLDTVDRLPLLKDVLNIGLCNITKCCTEVCPEKSTYR
jgi:succinate dehydrogenase / fumarate reductase iron-sulfur subunit